MPIIASWARDDMAVHWQVPFTQRLSRVTVPLLRLLLVQALRYTCVAVTLSEVGLPFHAMENGVPTPDGVNRTDPPTAMAVDDVAQNAPCPLIPTPTGQSRSVSSVW